MGQHKILHTSINYYPIHPLKTVNPQVRRWVLRCKWAVEEEARRHMEAAYIEAEQSRDVQQMQQQMANMPHSQQVQVAEVSVSVR
jgi:hypothetical protein